MEGPDRPLHRRGRTSPDDPAVRRSPLTTGSIETDSAIPLGAVSILETTKRHPAPTRPPSVEVKLEGGSCRFGWGTATLAAGRLQKTVPFFDWPVRGDRVAHPAIFQGKSEIEVDLPLNLSSRYRLLIA